MICDSCQKRQVDQSATRCPVCNVNLVCYIPNIALRNAARELACTCKHCNCQITAEAVESHKNECGEIPLQWNTCTKNFHGINSDLMNVQTRSLTARVEPESRGWKCRSIKHTTVPAFPSSSL